MRSVSQGPAPETLSSSSSAFWGHCDDDGGTETIDNRKQGNAAARSTALEMQLAFLGFDEDSD